MKEAIKKNKNYLFQYDYNKQTGFHWASKLGYVNLLKFLCESGNYINLYGLKMRTPIYLAALFNQYECLEILINYGANSFLCDSQGKKPIDVTTSEKCKKILSGTVEKPYFDLYNNK